MIIKGTSSYKNAKTGNLVSITGDGGNAWGFFGNSYKKLAPKLYLWQYYYNNPDKLMDEEIIDWYIKEYYKTRLQSLDANDLLKLLNENYGEEIVLLCHELPGKILNKEHFCHRRLIADWIELETGIMIPEISIDKNGNINYEEIYDTKPKLKKLIKQKNEHRL